MKLEVWNKCKEEHSWQQDVSGCEHSTSEGPLTNCISETQLNRQGITTCSRRSFMVGQEEMMSDLVMARLSAGNLAGSVIF